MTPVSLPDFNPFPESVLNHVPIHREIESPIFYDHHIDLDQYHTFESLIDKLKSSHFYEIVLNQNVTQFLKFVIQFKFLIQY